jgi:hypothetical protein
MKFLIQKINGQIKHDFAFTLLQSIDFKNWLNRGNSKDKIIVKYANTEEGKPIGMNFKLIHADYVPVGSVEFVSSFCDIYHHVIPKPINVPEDLFVGTFQHTRREIFNGTEKDLKRLDSGKWFVKSNDKIKGFSDIFKIDNNHVWDIPKGNYQFSRFISIDSEWRAFVYKGKLVGLQNYAGEFTKFPKVDRIESMILAYKSAPVAYTLDVGVNDYDTFVIECHDMFSCGLYGFADHSIYPNMLNGWFREYLRKQ